MFLQSWHPIQHKNLPMSTPFPCYPPPREERNEGQYHNDFLPCRHSATCVAVFIGVLPVGLHVHVNVSAAVGAAHCHMSVRSGSEATNTRSKDGRQGVVGLVILNPYNGHTSFLPKRVLSGVSTNVKLGRVRRTTCFDAQLTEPYPDTLISRVSPRQSITSASTSTVSPT